MEETKTTTAIEVVSILSHDQSYNNKVTLIIRLVFICVDYAPTTRLVKEAYPFLHQGQFPHYNHKMLNVVKGLSYAHHLMSLLLFLTYWFHMSMSFRF